MNGMRKQLLIVDADVVSQRELARQVETLGRIVVASAPCGESALARVDIQRPDVVLMNVDLGGEMDGIETSIKLHSRYDTPVIFMTDGTDHMTLDRARRAGPFPVWTKGGRISRLFDLLRKAFCLRRVYRQISLETAPAIHHMSRRCRFDEEGITS